MGAVRCLPPGYRKGDRMGLDFVVGIYQPSISELHRLGVTLKCATALMITNAKHNAPATTV